MKLNSLIYSGRLKTKTFSHKLGFERYRLDIRKTSSLVGYYNTATGWSKEDMESPSWEVFNTSPYKTTDVLI